MTVTVYDPVPPPPPGPSEVESTTTVDIGTVPASFGDTLSAGVSVEVDGGIDVSGEAVTVEADGVAVGTGTLADAGGGVFPTVAPVTHVPHVGRHEVVARFDGVQDSDPGTTDVLPSASAAESFTVARAATTTTITQAPSSVRAFGTIDVAATSRAVTVTRWRTPAASSGCGRRRSCSSSAALRSSPHPVAGGPPHAGRSRCRRQGAGGPRVPAPCRVS